MKFFKRILAGAMAAATLAMACCLSSCGGGKKYKVGIIQQAPHVALDAATEGFKKALIDKLGEENVQFEFQNAAGDTATCSTIAANFVAKKMDLVMANGTSALQAMAGATTTIPVLGTSITEYGVALGLKDFNGVTGINVSGTSDLAPLNEQAQMILDLFPETKKVGLLYCSAEPNSEYQVKVVKEYLEAKGITCTNYSFSDSNDIIAVTTAAADNSDVIYVPTDNKAAECKETIGSIVSLKKVPVIAGEEGICSGCGVAAFSISYYEIGYKTGEMAAAILKGESDITKLPIAYDPNPVKKYNKTFCEELGIPAPEGYVAIGD